jgi:hypothetical protein
MIFVSRAIVLPSRSSNPTAHAVFSAVDRVAVVEFWRALNEWIFDPYRPELHYMRGPGPKWREKHAHIGRKQSSQ